MDILPWVVEFLERDEEIVVPIKKMWSEWHAAHAETSLEDFTAAVLADPRIENMGGVGHADGLDDVSAEELAEYQRDMEAAGYFSGLRVKLKSRPITLEHIARMMTKHSERMEEALRGARAAMPEAMSEEEKGTLIDLIAQVEELRRKLREAGLELDEDKE